MNENLNHKIQEAASKKGGWVKYLCFNPACRFKVWSQVRPKECPKCKKVSHESQLRTKAGKDSVWFPGLGNDRKDIAPDTRVSKRARRRGRR